MSEAKVYEIRWRFDELVMSPDMVGKRFVSVEDCKRMVKEAWNEGYQACADILAGKPSPWEGQETCAALKRLGGE